MLLVLSRLVSLNRAFLLLSTTSSTRTPHRIVAAQRSILTCSLFVSSSNNNNSQNQPKRSMSSTESSPSSPSSMSIKDRFVGDWELQSWYAEDRGSNGGKRTFPFGENALGRILYTSTGRVSASLSVMKRKQPLSGGKNFFAYTHDEKAAAFGETLGYTGDFDIDEESCTVTHHVFISSDPGQAGTDLTRDYAFSSDYQTLSLSLTYHDQTKMVLVWKRLQPHVHNSTPSSSTTTRSLG